MKNLALNNLLGLSARYVHILLSHFLLKKLLGELLNKLFNFRVKSLGSNLGNVLEFKYSWVISPFENKLFTEFINKSM